MSKRTISHLPPLQRLAAARAANAKVFPYFEVGIQTLVPLEVPGLGTLGVTPDSILLVDNEVLGQWTADEAGTVVCHEFLHIYLRHEPRFQRTVAAGLLQSNRQDRALWNDAADCEVNNILRDANLSLPGIKQPDGQLSVATTCDLFRYDKGLTAEQYAHLMIEDRKQGRNQGKGSAGGQHPGCGSGSGGNELPGEPPPGSPLGREPVEQQMVRQMVSEAIVAAAKSVGNVPGQLLRMAEKDIPDARVRWEDELQSEITNSIEFMAGQGDFTWEVRNPHQGSLDLMMGMDAPVMPGEHSPQVEVAGIIDTSGSMGEEELSLAAGEVKGILEAVGGANITFMAIDCAVQEMVQVSSIEEVLRLLKGGGGTDFRPAFAELLKKADPRPNIAVYVTDGWGTAPPYQPAWLSRAIWVITPGGHRCATWGKTIYMDGRPSEEGVVEMGNDLGEPIGSEDEPEEDDDE